MFGPVGLRYRCPAASGVFSVLDKAFGDDMIDVPLES
jgi:hypothetical protein